MILRIIGFVASRVGSNPTVNTECIGGQLALVNVLRILARMGRLKSFKFNADVAQLAEAIGLDPIQ